MDQFVAFWILTLPRLSILYLLLSDLFKLNALNSPLLSFFSEFGFRFIVYMLYFNFDPAHLDDVILLQQVSRRANLVLKLEESDDSIHALIHLDRRQRWITCLKVEVVNVVSRIAWDHTFNIVFVPDLVHLEQLLKVVPKFLFDVTVHINELK